MRSLLNYVGIGHVNHDGIAKRFGVSDASDLITELLKRELLEPSKDYPGHYECGPQASQFANAKFMKPINRDRADQIVRETLHRIDEANQNPEFLWSVERVSVFGSYADPTREDFADIDLAVNLERRHPELTRQQFTLLERDRALASGRQFRNYMEELFYPRREVLRFIKAKDPYLSLHTFEELKELGIEGKPLYQRS